MNESKFQTAVTNRANERVQAKIRAFKSAVAKAVRELDVEVPSVGGPDYTLALSSAQRHLSVLVQGNTTGWSRKLWDNEERKVTAELFELMSEMERAVMAKAPAPDDVKPEEPPAPPAPPLPPRPSLLNTTLADHLSAVDDEQS